MRAEPIALGLVGVGAILIAYAAVHASGTTTAPARSGRSASTTETAGDDISGGDGGIAHRASAVEVLQLPPPIALWDGDGSDLCSEPPDLKPSECPLRSCPCGQIWLPNILGWGPSCYARIMSRTTGTAQLWLPEPWWSSTHPRPYGLAIVLHRWWLFDYAINVYTDGLVVFQSLRCPRDYTVHTRNLSWAAVDALIDAFRDAQFMTMHFDSPGVTDSGIDTLAFYDEIDEHSIITFTGGDRSASTLIELANLVDQAAETASWLRSSSAAHDVVRGRQVR